MNHTQIIWHNIQQYHVMNLDTQKVNSVEVKRNNVIFYDIILHGNSSFLFKNK